MSELWRRLRFLFARRDRESELADEMAFHREMMAREGRSTAHFGDGLKLREDTADAWGWGWLDRLRQDLRYGTRILARSPGFTIAAIAVLALAIGANTAIVSVLQTALLHPLGLRDADRIVSASVRIDKLKMDKSTVSGAEYADLRAMTDVFSEVAAVENRAWILDNNGVVSRMIGRAVTPEFFRVFGQVPALGRFLNQDDERGLVLSHSLWRTRFAGDASVLGSLLVLDGVPHRIVGVAPESFHFPAEAEAWTLLPMNPDRLQHRGFNMVLHLFGRLRDGVTETRAAQRINGYVENLKSAGNPDAQMAKELGYFIDLEPVAHFIAGDLRRPLLLLWASALLVLLIGCANVGGLLLARTAGRAKEMAIRLSLGATRGRVLRQLIVESLILGCAGGIAGLAVARGALALLKKLSLSGSEALQFVALDGRLLAYGLALALASALLFGLAPAVQVLRRSQTQAMARARRRRFQSAFVIAEVAGALVLLVATGLLLRSLWTVQQIEVGFDTNGLQTAYLIKPKDAGPYLDRLLEKLRHAPGVESAALTYPLPYSGGGMTSLFKIEGRDRRPNEPEWHGEGYMVSPGYLETLRIPILRGRALAETDTKGSPAVCVIDRSMADRFFPGQDPLGQQIGMYGGLCRIVGVAAAVRATSLEEGSRPTVYYSLKQIPFFPHEGIVVRSHIPAASLIREAVREAGPGVPAFDFKSMDERIAQSLGIRKIMVVLLAAFGAMTLLLAMIGVHGVVAQIVGERRTEIGVRMAMGARPGQILAHFLRFGLVLGSAGVAIGLSLATWAQRFVASFLYQAPRLDVMTFTAAALALLIALLAAAAWPSIRAARVAPQEALRHD